MRRHAKIILFLLTLACLPSRQTQSLPPPPNDPLAAPVAAPTPERSVALREVLAPGCQVAYNGYCGSGTVVYFDGKEGWVLTCGHLFERRGELTAEQSPKANVTCLLTFFYHNNEPRRPPVSYVGRVVFYRIDGLEDIALVRFTPDWMPEYAKIAPREHRMEVDRFYHSIGCDRVTEVACYAVQYVGTRVGKLNLSEYVTQCDSPRPGRSGGGLLTDDMMLVGVCVRTSSVDGRGMGYFTPLSQIHTVLKEEGHGWLLDVPTRRVPRTIAPRVDVDAVVPLRPAGYPIHGD